MEAASWKNFAVEKRLGTSKISISLITSEVSQAEGTVFLRYHFFRKASSTYLSIDTKRSNLPNFLLSSAKRFSTISTSIISRKILFLYRFREAVWLQFIIGPVVMFQYMMELSFLEAARGVNKTVRVQVVDECSQCQGSRCQPGFKPVTCPYCNGTGMVSLIVTPHS